jgi:hypothetical protein
MPDTAKQVIKARTENHSDVADTKPARAYQAAMTERQFGDALLRHLRELKADVCLRNFQEEWLPTDDGLVHELSAEIAPSE